MVLIAALASVLDKHLNGITLPANTLISGGTGIGKDDFTATVWSWCMLGHPIRANRNSERAIRAIFATRSQSAIRIWVDSGYTTVAKEASLSVNNQAMQEFLPC
jgi:hypothetical protein